MFGPHGEGVPPIVHDVLRSTGQPLDASTRGDMEGRFGHDFSGVRVHTGPRAAESAEAVSAKAYTVGQKVVFGQGHYTPETGEGRSVLAHELTHVVQQSRGGMSPPLDPNSSLEQEADAAAANAVKSHAPIAVGGASGAGLARLSWKDVRKKVRPVASLLGGDLGEKALDGAVSRAEAITGPDVPTPAETLVNRGIQAIGTLTPQPKPSPTSDPSSPKSTPTGEEGVRLAVEHLTGTPQPAPPAPLAPPRVDPKEDTPELKQLFKERWRKAQVFHGIKLMYVAQSSLTRAQTSYHVAKKTSHYWIISHGDKETGEVYYYSAYNPHAKRDEYAIGPAELDTFYEAEASLDQAAALTYLRGEPSAYQVKSAQAVEKATEGDLGGAVGGLLDANVEAVQDPDWWFQNATAYAGANTRLGLPPRFGRWLGTRGTGALLRITVAADETLPAHTGGGARLVNTPSIVAGEVRAPLVESGLPASNVAKASATVPGAVAAVPDIAADVPKPAVAGKAPTAAAPFVPQSPAIAPSAVAPIPGNISPTTVRAPANESPTRDPKAEFLARGGKITKLPPSSDNWDAPKISVGGNTKLPEGTHRVENSYGTGGTPRNTTNSTAQPASTSQSASTPQSASAGQTSTQSQPEHTTVIRSVVGAPVARGGYERILLRGVEVNLRGWQRAHSQGAGTGVESRLGILYAPPEVNLELQNAGVEETIRELYRSKPADVTLHLITETTAHPGTNRLKQINYRLEASKPGEVNQIQFEAHITVSNDTNSPRITYGN